MTLHVGSVLKIRGHPRDLVQVDKVLHRRFRLSMFGQVMVNGVNVNPPLLTTSDLQRTFGSWAVRDAEFTFLDEIEVFKPASGLEVRFIIEYYRVAKRSVRWS